jgi:hypothetical protein
MGDYQFWLYVLIGVIYLLARVLKKPAQKPTDVPDSRPDRPVARFEPPPAKPRAPSKTLTFEELLREITESKAQPQPAPERDADVNYDEELKEEAQDLEDVNYDYKTDKVTLEYEAAKQQAFLRPSLEETLSIKDTDTKFEKFKAFEVQTQANLLDKYLIDFSDPEGLKKAIVMSEILQRKF